MEDATLSIGEVAEKAGSSVSAIRFYEREGLLPEAERVSGQRRFTEETVQRLGIIDVAKQAGFSLEEVGVLLASMDEGAPAHEQLQALAARKLPEVDALIERAQAMRDWLTTASDCGCDSLESCTLFVADRSRSRSRLPRAASSPPTGQALRSGRRDPAQQPEPSP
jgi:MerR family redox-sensitive transcriptional activator SoxR